MTGSDIVILILVLARMFALGGMVWPRERR
jgi:hypothetical protein